MGVQETKTNCRARSSSIVRPGCRSPIEISNVAHDARAYHDDPGPEMSGCGTPRTRRDAGGPVGKQVVSGPNRDEKEQVLCTQPRSFGRGRCLVDSFGNIGLAIGQLLALHQSIPNHRRDGGGFIKGPVVGVVIRRL
jgi:hypothetical protein